MDQQAKERVIIAKDALKWIEAGALIPKAQYEVVPTISAAHKLYDTPLNLGVCQVCLVGGLFLAQAVRDTDCTVRNIQYGEIRKSLTKFFSREQLDLIEVYFEGQVYAWNNSLCQNTYMEDKARQFVEQHPNDSKRMKLILKNIVKNKGTFCPDKL